MDITRIDPTDRAAVFRTLVAAFRDDAVERWLYPTDDAYDRHVPAFVEAFGGRAIDAGTAWRVGDFEAVALWFPPGVEVDGPAVVEVLLDTVDRNLHDDVLATLAEMDAAHPRPPHWYLPWLGVRPDRRGGGLGGLLLGDGLARVDATGHPVYLETPNPRTVHLYERHGFTVTGHTENAACPPITFMWRSAMR
jgi:GNAT superfamily N-acetyltransferase